MLNKNELESLIKILKKISKTNSYNAEIKRFAKGLLGYLNEYYFTHF